MFQEFPEDNTTDNYLNERRQKIAEEGFMNYEEQRNDLKRSRSVFIGAVSGLALAAVVGWFALSPRYAVENATQIPTIRRPQTAVKVKPENPGGMEILNQDKTVYDIIEKEPQKAEVESVLPPPEQPILPTINAETIQAQAEAAAPQANTAAELPPVVESKTVETANVKTIAEPKAVVNEVAEQKLPTIKEASIAQNESKEVKAPTAPKEIKAAAQPIAAKPTEAVSKSTASILENIAQNKTAEPAAQTAAKGGDWQVQLMSSPNQKAVNNAWGGLVKKHPQLASEPHEVETADLGAKGTYYRLKAGAFSSRDGADKLCNSIKAQGGSCIVKKK